MAAHEGDSSDDDGDYTTTNVMLGYASKEPTDDPFSQLGGTPTWPNNEPPSSSLAKCKTCNSYMTLLLELNGDLPEVLPDHERRHYVFACRNKPCRRKPGTIRAVRGIKISPSATKQRAPPKRVPSQSETQKPSQPTLNLGDTIFKSKSPIQPSSNPNPFSTSSQQPSPNPNPFSSTKAANPIPYGHQKRDLHSVAAAIQSKPPPPEPKDPETTLSHTFAQKAQISSPSSNPDPPPHEPWPSPSSLPKPYPSYHLDADYETLDAPSPPAATPSSSLTQPAANDKDPLPASNEDDDPASWLTGPAKADTTFLRFASRLAQNPEQVLRYEFGGQPLLYSKTDEVGLAFPQSPHPHASSSS
ncbi:MAG: hypothetical protein Q9212_007470, partial [Teloschistes hypoglaucus]